MMKIIIKNYIKMQFPNKKYDGLHIPNLLSLEDEERLKQLINCDIFDSLFISVN